VRSEPRLLLRDGSFNQSALRIERVTEGEALAAIRKQGHGNVEKIAALVLETDGSFSVITADDRGALSALKDVQGTAERQSSSMPSSGGDRA
jgi:uncharacterized membrane protein YcaP (DUF421 family)